MTLMNVMDSVFYLGLVVTFLLILLVVYHFKNRVTTMEHRCDTMFEIMNNIVQELNILRRQQKMTLGGREQPHMTTTMEGGYLPEEHSQVNQYEQEDGESSSEYETDDEEDDENSELSDNDLEEDSDDEPTEKVIELTNELTNESPIPEATTTSLMEINDNVPIKIEKVDATLENETNEEENSDPKMEAYKSMTNSALKALVIEKGLSTNPSKLKKSDLLDLLKELE